MARVLIAGCGFVGGRIAARLLETGNEVWGLRRRTGALPDGVRPLAADLTRPDRLAILPHPIDSVFFTAGADGPGEATYRAIYVDGLRKLIDALAARKPHPQRLVVASSTAVYGQDAGEWVDEESPTAPSRHQGQVLLESEAVACAAPFPATVVRLGGIYGPGRTRLIDQVQAGGIKVGPAPHYTNRIHRDDAAGFFCHLLGLAAPLDLYLGVDDEPADQRVVVEWLAERLGVPQPRTDPGAAGAPSGKRCRNRRLHATGYLLRHPTFREGYATMLGGDGQ